MTLYSVLPDPAHLPLSAVHVVKRRINHLPPKDPLHVLLVQNPRIQIITLIAKLIGPDAARAPIGEWLISPNPTKPVDAAAHAG